MNRNQRFELNSPSAAQPWLDRLVDGELSFDEERQLLLALDGDSDGWRRCALAFVEARAWRSELAAAPAELSATQLSATPSPPIAMGGLAPRSKYAQTIQRLAVAAALLFAFALGALLTSSWQGDANKNADPLIAQQPPAASESQPAAVPAGRKWEALKISLPGADGKSHFVKVPLVAADDAASALLADSSSPLPADVQAALERSGHRVVRERSYFPVSLEDGSQAVLPIDLVEVTAQQHWQ